MQLLAAVRGLGVVLLGGTLVSVVPKLESPARTASLPEGSPVESRLQEITPRVTAERRDDAAFGAAVPRSPAAATLPPKKTFDAHQRPVLQVAAAAEKGTDATAKPKEHLKAKVFLSLDKLPAGEKCKFVVILDIEKGWHVNANPPSPENMIPTTVTVKSQQGSRQIDAQYPAGKPIMLKDLPEPLSVYEGEVLIRGVIEAPPDAAGTTDELEFQVRYQACNDKNCLPPKTLKLAGKIDIVKPGTPVKQINQKYFPAK
jgi:hypothetical protein